MITNDPPFLATDGDADGAYGIRRPIALCLAVLGLSAILFYVFPSLDLAVSNVFYVKDAGFVLGKTRPIVAMRNLGIWITVATILGLIGLGIWWRIDPKALERWPSPTPWLDWIFITTGMAVGPGVLVNLIFKPVFGRARPINIEQFGGKDHFTAAWEVAGQCRWNCAFFSGEAAASAFILAFCFVVPARWRLATLVVAGIVTLLVSFARMAAGGHFLSDVVTAWLMMILMILVLRAQIYHGVLHGPLGRWLSTT